MSTRILQNYVCLSSPTRRTGKSGKAVKIHQLDLEGNFYQVSHDSIKLANESLGLAIPIIRGSTPICIQRTASMSMVSKALCGKMA
jgi:hypothetical protein